ncbi:hypothetical protein AALG46_11205 [Faecalibaculum rodentium]
MQNPGYQHRLHSAGQTAKSDSVLNARFNQFTDEQKEKILDTIEDVAQSAKLPGQ